MGHDNAPQGKNEQAVDSQVYDAEWIEKMGGSGSNRLFLNSGSAGLRPRLAYALDIARIEPGMEVLDIGCGRAEATIQAARMGARCVGLDYADVSVNKAMENISAAEVENCSVCRADAKSLPFANQSFDRVLMFDIVEHLHEWELQKMWAEVHRVLKPDGLAVIHTLPNRWALDVGFKLIRKVLPNMPRTISDMRDVFHVNEQTPPSLNLSLGGVAFKRHVWLHDLMTAQAAFVRDHQLGTDEAQANVYGRLNRQPWRALYRLATALPTRLILVTDLFAVAWKSERPDLVADLPAARAERACTWLARLWRRLRRP